MTPARTPLFNRALIGGLAAFLAFALNGSAQTTPPVAEMNPAPTELVPEPAPMPIPPAPVLEALPAPLPPAPTQKTPAAPLPPALADANNDFAVTPAGAGPVTGVLIGQNVENPNLISIALDNVPLEDVVRLFTRISGANIIATTSNLQGTVTVNLTDVEWRPALSSILDMHGLVLQEKTPGTLIFSIVPKPIGAPEPLLTETVFLRYAGVSNTVSVIRPLLPAGATVSPYLPANALVIRSTENSISEIRKIVEKIDTPRQQVFIEAKFIELNDKAIEDLGVNWQVLQSFGVHAKGIQSDITETTSKTKTDSHGVLGVQEKRTSRARSLANDVPVAGTDLGNDRVNQKVFDDKLNGKNITDFTYDPIKEAMTWDQVPTYDLKRVRTAILSVDDVSLMLSALKQTDGASVVSNPKIVVANEESAIIHIGETERPFISTVTPGSD
ncbi:MAG: secretin N-terminal domain-containing protein, partial [Kiritimatiellia bacterium]